MIRILAITMLLGACASAAEEKEDKRIQEAVRSEVRGLENSLNVKIEALRKEVEELRKEKTAPATSATATPSVPKQDLGGASNQPEPTPPKEPLKTPPPPQPTTTTTEEPKDIDQPTTPAEVVPYRKYWVQTSALNVRSGPSMQFPVVRVVRRGEEINEIGKEGRWIKVAENEYLYMSYLSDTPISK